MTLLPCCPVVLSKTLLLPRLFLKRRYVSLETLWRRAFWSSNHFTFPNHFLFNNIVVLMPINWSQYYEVLESSSPLNGDSDVEEEDAVLMSVSYKKSPTLRCLSCDHTFVGTFSRKTAHFEHRKGVKPCPSPPSAFFEEKLSQKTLHAFFDGATP
ncbi:hypothetical protein P9112_006159 [Eukaryota sp. TZLM1-RC]